MNKKNASVFLAIVLDLIFASCFLFYFVQSPGEKITLHMNQVGIYENEKNATQMIEQLKKLDIEAFYYPKEDLFIVVTTPTSKKQQSLDEQSVLNEHDIPFLFKEVTSSSPFFVEAAKQKDIKKVLEVMSHQGS